MKASRPEFYGSGRGQNQLVTGGVSAERLLRRPVRVRGIRVGYPTDVVLDAERMRAIGLEVLCGDDSRRFLPLPAARVQEDEIAVGSALLLLDERDLSFYSKRSRTFRSLRGRTVEQRGHPLGALLDLVLAEDGAIAQLEVEIDGDHRRRLVTLDGTMKITDDGRVSAA